MQRREFIGLVGGAAAWPLAARAQQNGIRRVGVLVGYAESDPAAQALVAAFQQALGKLGWTEGNNVRISVRFGSFDKEKTKKFAKELIELQPDVILTQSTPTTSVVAQETQTVPIVFTVVSDPIGSGFAASITHPGRNITGFTNVDGQLGGKWLQLLTEIAPQTKHVALLYNPITRPPKFYTDSIEVGKAALAITTSEAPVNTKDEYESVIAEQAGQPGVAFIVLPDIFNTANRDLINELAVRYKVPMIYGASFYAESGGLIAYSPDFPAMFRQAATYVDRILKGEKAADLPIQFPSKFELVINLKTAKAIGVTIPPAMLTRADKIIE